MGWIADCSDDPPTGELYRSQIVSDNNRCHKETDFFAQGAVSARFPGPSEAVSSLGRRIVHANPIYQQ